MSVEIEMIEKRLEISRLELLLLEKKNTTNTNLKPGKSLQQKDVPRSASTKTGPLTAAEREARVRKICQCMSTHPIGTSIPSAKIAKETGIWNSSQSCFKWMLAYMKRPECPWKQGQNTMSFILK